MPSAKRYAKEIAKQGFEVLHRAMLPAKLIVLPNHYYTPVADRRELARTKQFWAKRAPLHGIDLDVDRQLGVLKAEVAPFEAEYRGNKRNLEGIAREYGPGFGYIEAQCLHGAVRALKPKRVLEVGSGVSTYLIQGAVERNAAEGRPAEITCVEPFPSKFIRENTGVKLVQSLAQHVDPALFDTLESGDFLFIDSTHAMKPGGDVEYLYLSVLPRLKPGVVVHIHDITFPYLHLPSLLTSIFQWTETSVLAALLTNNTRLRVRYCLSMLHHDAPDELRRVFPEYQPRRMQDGLDIAGEEGHFPSSIYLQTY